MTLLEVLAVWGITLNERQAQQLLEEMMGAGALLTREEAAADLEVVRVVRERDPLRRKIDDWAQAYPTSVFPEPDHKSTGHDPTLCSAAMGRHILNTLQGYYETEVTDDE